LEEQSMPLSAGDRLGRYEILGPVGAGGMGEVYRARDTQLEREVAIKVLPESVAQNSDRLTRFEREAKAVARLSHPNILEIYDFGRHEDVTYSVTELLEGETLRERIDAGAIGWRKAAEIGAAIADGLAAAHRAGIVHRDLKPSNVFLTPDGRVKVLDFGLARTGPPPDADVSVSKTVSYYTDPGMVFGTAGYMSPEQVRGDPADHRSDIFCLGSLLYEMACGQRAFWKDTAAETMTAILKEEPTDLGSVAGDLPASLDGVIRRCLEKRPQARFQSCHDLAFALRSTLQDNAGPVVRSTSEEKSIVVLPFENLSPDPEQEFFCDGMTEEIILTISKVRSMKVISRTSSMRLKNTGKDLRTIGTELNVRYVLEGSVRKAGNDLLITAQLIDSRKDSHLWAEKYRGTLEDVFAIQENVARSIVDGLMIELSPDEDHQITDRPTYEAQAYELYLRVRQQVLRGTRDDLSQALKTVQDGLDELGPHELLFAAKGIAHIEAISLAIEPGDGHLLAAQECIDKISALKPDSSHLHFLRGAVAFKQGNLQDGYSNLIRAHEIDPNDTRTLQFLSGLLAFAGKWTAARPFARQLFKVDPLTPLSQCWWSLVELLGGRFKAALGPTRVAHRQDPNDLMVSYLYALALTFNGRLEKVTTIVEPMTRHSPEATLTKVCRFLDHSSKGEREKALNAITPRARIAARGDVQLSWTMAGCYASLGMVDEALDWLENAAMNRGFINYPLLKKADPLLENLRGDHRFNALMDRIKQRWRDFVVAIDSSGPPPANGGA